MKYSKFVKKNCLCFTINEGQFKNITFKYDSLTEDKGLQYKILENEDFINEHNKFLFEREIKNILNEVLKNV